MALLLGDAAEVLSVSAHRAGTLETSASPLKKAIVLIANENRHKFRSVAKLARLLVQREGSYMSIDHVSVSSLDRIEERFKERGLRKRLQFTYETTTPGSLIIKSMAGVAHDMMATESTAHIRAKPRNYLHTHYFPSGGRYSSV